MALLRTPSATHAHIGAGCLLCGQSDDVIDTGRDIPHEGGVCICVGCVKDLARTIGVDPEHDIAECGAYVALLTDERDAALAELDEADALIRAIGARLGKQNEPPVLVPDLTEQVATVAAAEAVE